MRKKDGGKNTCEEPEEGPRLESQKIREQAPIAVGCGYRKVVGEEVGKVRPSGASQPQ